MRFLQILNPFRSYSAYSGPSPLVHAQDTDPAKVWDLTELYPDDEVWKKVREALLSDLESLKGRKGSLGDGAESFYETL